MDIENMHPFCLPFGLCHDATSSSITADLLVANNSNQNNGSATTNHQSSTSSVSPLSSPSSKESRLSAQRSKNLSPSDELFRQLNNISSTTILGQSLLSHHDLIIGSSASFDIIADDSSFYSSLDLDVCDATTLNDAGGDDENKLRKSSIETDVDFTDSDHKVEDEEEEEEPIDWYYGEYSLFSPTRRKSLSTSTAAAIRATNLLHHQVFQHLVDPIDIKSSPTLAQLNLNSNDNDPIDGFWDTARASSSLSLSLANPLSSSLSSAPTNTDLLSNCTSINKNSLTAGTCCSRTLNNNNHHHNHHHHHHHSHRNNQNSDNHSVCNHLNHHSQTQHYHTHLSSTYLSSSAHLTSCPHQQLNHQQQQHSSSYQQQHQHQPTCCATRQHNLVAPTNHSSLSINNGSNLKPSAALNELNQQQQQQQTSVDRHQPNGSSAASQVCSDSEHDPKKRPSSPVLVTSSSSPLSSSSSTTTPGQQQQQQQQQPSFVTNDANLSACGENNKLKENIEYLTALLCNGNKLESSNNQPPSSISSSMARSYTTLAHTLSTGPKLLERSLQPEMTSINGQQAAVNTVTNHPTNEAASCMDANLSAGIMKRPQHSIQQQQHHLQQPQWIKVESSISAADSTETPSMSYTIQAAHDCSTSGLNTQCLHHHQSQSIDPKHQPHQQQQQQRAPDLRVLSSLLSSPQGCTNHHLSTITPPNQSHSSCPRWPPAVSHQHHHHQPLPTAQQSQTPTGADSAQMPTDSQQRSSIPPNGRLITLTPITSHNNPILQQQQQQQQAQITASKTINTSPFIQPASPSASSTASSGANTDVGSSGSGPTIKKPRLANAQTSSASNSSSKSAPSHKSSTGGSSRSARPNSMSTECSLSSHDEGFSSQIDQDDCNSNRDSDDDDDVDSDDESFYGDYTNNDLIGASISDDAGNKWTLNMGRTRRNGQKRYFWQYNVQSKGPKGTRICPPDDSENPFVLPEASDPVFSNDCQVEGVKHSGKARRGDGNDLTPNPKKLLMIGLELKKLGKIINELAPVTDLPINARTKTRKEKNKLASRACRLKKKAQHEANKIKLYGLQREHQQAVSSIYDVRKLLNQALALKDNSNSQAQLARQLSAPSQPSRVTVVDENKGSSQLTTGGTATTNDAECIRGGAPVTTTTGATIASVFLIAEQCSMRVAGQTSDFVNSVLEKVVSGCIDGGLET